MRVDGWPEKLLALIDAHQHTPHAWGEHDCVMFAGKAVEVITGVDFVAQFRGTYSTEAEAEAILDREGGIEPWCVKHFGAPVAVGLARRGDLLIGPSPQGEDWLAVCVGQHGVVPGERYEAVGAKLVLMPSLVRFPLSRFRSAFRVD